MENYSQDYQHDNKVFINEGFHHEQYLRGNYNKD